MKNQSIRTNPIALTIGAVIAAAGFGVGIPSHRPLIFVAAVFAAAIVVLALQMAQAWERAVVLRAGKFSRVAGPGLFVLVPIADAVVAWIDQRVQTTSFTAEQTLTKDTVPVDVDAVLFWLAWDARKAALEVTAYRETIAWAAQTALRDIIGTTTLAELLSDRQAVDQRLQQTIDARTTPWGVTVQSVEIRDIRIPAVLQDAMSRQAQAQRELEARVILGQAENEIAQSFVDASKVYSGNPIALHLRAMNMLYEGLKEKGAMVIVPSTAVETMGLGTIGGLTGITNAAAQLEAGPQA